MTADMWEGFAELLTEMATTMKTVATIASLGGSAYDITGGSLHQLLGENLTDLIATIDYTITCNDFDEKALGERYEQALDRLYGKGLNS